MHPLLSDRELPPASPPEWTEQRALDERPPPEPVRVPVWARIIGWIVNIITGLAGG
jgi:hypothetical protein